MNPITSIIALTIAAGQVAISKALAGACLKSTENSVDPVKRFNLGSDGFTVPCGYFCHLPLAPRVLNKGGNFAQGQSQRLGIAYELKRANILGGIGAITALSAWLSNNRLFLIVPDR